MELANSNEVIDELSNAIGKPKNDETEEEFVKRAKITFENILRKKLL